MPDTPTPPPPPPPPPFGVPSASDFPAPPSYTPAPAGGVTTVQKRGLGGRFLAAAVGVAVLGGGLAFAVTQAGGGGASSPEAAARELFAAISDEDLIGVMDVLPAGERRAFQQPIEAMGEELSRLGVLADGLDLSSLAGIDLAFDEMEFTSVEIGEGVAAVSVASGTFSIELAPDELPLGEDLVSVIEEMSGEPLVIEPFRETSDFDPSQDSMTLIAVEDGGSWRISLFYSIAEAVRTGAGLGVPDFGNGIRPAGQPSPEEAVEALLESALDLDVEGVIALLPPDEMAVLQDYAPLFLEDLDLSDVDFDAEINELDLSADVDGDTAVVTLGDFSVDLVIDGEAGTIGFADGCFVVDAPGETIEQCTDDFLADSGAPDLPIDLDASEGLGGFATVQVDGQWYVSPTRSVLGQLVALLESVHDDAVTRLPELIESFAQGFDDFTTESGLEESLGGAIGGELDELEDDFEEDFGDGFEDATSTTISGQDLDDPSREALVTMLEVDQGFMPDEAGCIADEIYAAGFDDHTLSVLQTGEIPPEVEEQVFAIVDFCLS